MKTQTSFKSFINARTLIAQIVCLFLFTLLVPYHIIAQTDDVYEQPATVTPPDWAPAYDNAPQVQYYYMPDIEVYYDVWRHEFVYLEEGNWLFSATLPSMYSWYDLRRGHVVVLDHRVHRPWMHHELYVSHYPRYYHHVVYRTDEHGRPHGYNENSRKAIYDPHPEKEMPRTQPERRTPVQYQNKYVGQPVNVDKHMTRPVNQKRR